MCLSELRLNSNVCSGFLWLQSVGDKELVVVEIDELGVKNLRDLLQQLRLGGVPLAVRLHLEKCVAGLALLLRFLHFHFREDGKVERDRYGLQ